MRSRATWSGGLGLALGSCWLSADDVTDGGSLAVNLNVHAGRGLTDKTLLVADVSRSVAHFVDATDGDLRMTIYGLTATHFLFDGAGLFVSVGGGYVKTDRFSLYADAQPSVSYADGVDGFALRGELGYEWRIGETFGLGLQFRTERVTLDKDIDEVWTFVGGTNLRWYM